MSDKKKNSSNEKINKDFEKSYTHDREKPDGDAPTGRTSQSESTESSDSSSGSDQSSTED